MTIENGSISEFSASKTNTPPRSDYRLPDNQQISALVGRIKIVGPPGFIKPGELAEMAQRVNVEKAMRALPDGITEKDFLEILELSLLTECATNTYAREFNESARRYNQPWLGDFTTNVWTPDELMHHLPFKTMLMQLGSSEKDLNQKIDEARGIDYVHAAGSTPIHLTTFGMIQESLTDNWYGLTREILLPTSPEAAHMVTRVKKRETLHTVWYRNMTALQIEENPQLIPHVAETASRFEMPGNQIVPDLQKKAADWLPRMGADVAEIKRNIVRLTAQSVNNPANVGRLLIEIAAQYGQKLGPFKPEHVQAAFNMFGNHGYGLVGEGVLEGVGVKSPYKDNEIGIVDKIRGTVRTWVAGQVKERLL